MAPRGVRGALHGLQGEYLDFCGHYRAIFSFFSILLLLLQGEFPAALAAVPNLERLNITGNRLR